jgi:hypothetical protein
LTGIDDRNATLAIHAVARAAGQTWLTSNMRGFWLSRSVTDLVGLTVVKPFSCRIRIRLVVWLGGGAGRRMPRSASSIRPGPLPARSGVTGLDSDASAWPGFTRLAWARRPAPASRRAGPPAAP